MRDPYHLEQVPGTFYPKVMMYQVLEMVIYLDIIFFPLRVEIRHLQYFVPVFPQAHEVLQYLVKIPLYHQHTAYIAAIRISWDLSLFIQPSSPY